MTKKFVLLFVGVILSLVSLIFSVKYGDVFAAVGDTQWASSATIGPDTSSISSIKSDTDGNTYAVGYINGTGTYNFGNSVTASGGNANSNALIIKYNSAGVAQWAKSTTTGPSSSVFQGVSIDSVGNAYAVGYINGTGTYNFGNSVTVAGDNTGTNIIIVKYNSAGLAQWAKSTTTGPNLSFLYGVTTDTDGNSYAVGYIYGSGSYDFGDSITVSSAGSSNAAFIIKYDTSGIAQWAKSTSGGPSSSFFNGVHLDSNNNIYAVGSISGSSSYDFGNSVTVAGGYSDNNAVIVKYNASGLAQWAKSTTGSAGASSFQSATTDSNGDIYVTGYMVSDNTFNFGNSVTVAGGNASSNAIIVKYNTSGLAQWAKSTSAASPESTFYSIVADSNDNIYVVGSIMGNSTVDLGNSLTISGQYSFDTNAVIVKYNTSGLAQWAKSTSAANGNSLFNSISLDGNNNRYAAGGINNNEQFGFGNSITVTGGYNGGLNVVTVKYSDVTDTQTNTDSGTGVLSNSGSTSCTGETPSTTPDLFQINIIGTSAKLFFTPISNTSIFYLSYSTKTNAEEHGVFVNLGNNGVQDFTINMLKPSTKYYFKVRGQKECVAGNWSTILSARSKSIWNTISTPYYKYQ